jgi:hypothetical protein
MPTAKKSATKSTTRKKAEPKKAAPKKKATPKAKAKPKVVAPPVQKSIRREIKLLSDYGSTSLMFNDEASFDAALAIIRNAPSDSGGSRSVPMRTVFAANQKYTFRLVYSFSVHEL